MATDIAVMPSLFCKILFSPIEGLASEYNSCAFDTRASYKELSPFSNTKKQLIQELVEIEYCIQSTQF